MRHALVILVFALAVLATSLPYDALFGLPAGNRWELYLALLYGTGVVSIVLMSVAMVLALRLPVADRLLGGLDRCYRAHRWAALLGLGFGLTHYLVKLGSKKLRADGVLVKPEDFVSRTLDFVRPVKDPAEVAGEWGLYLALGLVALALLRKVPYGRFVQSHRLMPLVFSMMAFHALVFIPGDYWRGLAGPVTAVLALCGLVVAGFSLFGRIGRGRRAHGVITELRTIAGNVLELHAELTLEWSGHRSGQFALVSFDSREGTHPFTIASAWKGDGHVMFAIKALGDFTRELPGQLTVGDAIVVEGPYGSFDYADDCARQIWIAGGVGLTPFVARLQELAARGGSQRPIDLFYSTQMAYVEVVDRLTTVAGLAGVKLHVIEAKDGLLTADRVCEQVPEFGEASVWFCGPGAFGQALKRGLAANGFTDSRFHQEVFEFR